MSRTQWNRPLSVGVGAVSALQTAALDRSPVAGLTHCYYRYPARFSPKFARTAIELLSRPGDVVLDPYMGGGTTLVEALVLGRRAIGCDLNSLAVFVARVKTTPLNRLHKDALLDWADRRVPMLSYRDTPTDLSDFICKRRTKNLTLPGARPIKKVLALALRSSNQLPSKAADFARCALLNVGQWALNGRSHQPSLPEFRERLQITVHEMLDGLESFSAALPNPTLRPVLIADTAATLECQEPFSRGSCVNLVITSPPYPGIHMLYHRWQVDGRHESPAPYWLAECNDGHGGAFYNFANRSRQAEDKYFAESFRTLQSIRKVMFDGALIVQLVAFSSPLRQLPRYLRNMRDVGFTEVRSQRHRIWRTVPSRKWHATLKGDLPSSREVVLIHQAT
jgi:hypothetical protein